MKDNSVKLSGYAKDRFIERFFAEEPVIDEELRSRLVARGKSTFTSLRVRKAALVRRPVSSMRPAPLVSVVTRPQSVQAPPVAPEATPELQPEREAQQPVVEAPPAEVVAFDPYVFGLVPVFQREGAEGLLAKLATVDRVEHLRAMAKSQQIVLPQELRAGDASVDDVRMGIVEGVAKRIKDRRAAAG